jgi:hypothetical protein
MKEPEELTAKANDEVMHNMRWELSLVGLNTLERLTSKLMLLSNTTIICKLRDGRVLEDDDQIEDTQRDTHHTCTYRDLLLGDP